MNATARLLMVYDEAMEGLPATLGNRIAAMTEVLRKLEEKKMLQIEIKVVAPELPDEVHIEVLGRRIPVAVEDLTDEMVAAISQAFGDALAKEVAKCRAEQVARSKPHSDIVTQVGTSTIGSGFMSAGGNDGRAA